MSRGADVLAVLVPEAVERAEAAAALAAEAGRLAGLLGGAAEVLEVGPGDAGRSPEDVAAALAAHVRDALPRAVLFLDGDRSREIAPRLAWIEGTLAVIGCTGVDVVDDGTVYVKPVHGGWLEERCAYGPGALEVVTLVGAALSAAAPPGGAGQGGAAGAAGRSGGPDPDPGPGAAPGHGAKTLRIPPATAPPAVRRLELVAPDARTVDIVHAERIVAVGVGAVDSPLLDLARRLSELLEGSLAATRPVVDDGHLPKERLVGQTGRTVGPDLYLALGISGSPHHVAGIQAAGTILAVDRDPAAPVFQFADSGYLGDLREVLPALVRRIEEWRDGA